MTDNTPKCKSDLVKIDIGNLYSHNVFECRPHQQFEVPADVADACRLLVARGGIGAHVDKIGGFDRLAEFELYGIPYITQEADHRGTKSKKCWVVVNGEIAFPDHEDGDLLEASRWRRS